MPADTVVRSYFLQFDSAAGLQSPLSPRDPSIANGWTVWEVAELVPGPGPDPSPRSCGLNLKAFFATLDYTEAGPRDAAFAYLDSLRGNGTLGGG